MFWEVPPADWLILIGSYCPGRPSQLTWKDIQNLATDRTPRSVQVTNHVIPVKVTTSLNNNPGPGGDHRGPSAASAHSCARPRHPRGSGGCGGDGPDGRRCAHSGDQTRHLQVDWQQRQGTDANQWWCELHMGFLDNFANGKQLHLTSNIETTDMK